MRKHIKYFIKVAIVFQLVVGPLAKADLDFDFGDDGSVITSGEDRYDGRDDGNCVGSGCDDRDGRGSGRNDDDDRDDEHGRDFERDNNPNQNDDDRGGRGDYADRFEYQGHATAIEAHRIVQADRDRGDGVIFTRDDKGNVYYRGEESKYVDDGEGGYMTTDHRDIYTDRKGNDFVKSKDGTRLLPIDGLKDCAPTDTCRAKGYREDWWLYSYGPSLNNSQEASDWDDLESFYREQLRLGKIVDKAYVDPSVRASNEKYRVLKVADRLLQDARDAFIHDKGEEALALQKGVKELAMIFADVGLAMSPLGWAKDAYELITGKNAITGQRLSDTERIIAGLGVIMPGVGGLAIAGVHIIKDLKNGEKALEAVLDVEKTLEKLGLQAARFKEGKNLSEVAIIGRDMNSVKAIENQLKSAGVETRTLKLSDEAKEALKADFIHNGNKNIPYDKIPYTEAYKENMSWVQKILKDDISVIDIGNPKGVKEPSRFYDDEVRHIFGRGK